MSVAQQSEINIKSSRDQLERAGKSGNPSDVLNVFQSFPQTHKDNQQIQWFAISNIHPDAALDLANELKPSFKSDNAADLSSAQLLLHSAAASQKPDQLRKIFGVLTSDQLSKGSFYQKLAVTFQNIMGKRPDEFTAQPKVVHLIDGQVNFALLTIQPVGAYNGYKSGVFPQPQKTNQA